MYFTFGFQIYHIDNLFSEVSTAVIKPYSVSHFSSPSGPFTSAHKEEISHELAIIELCLPYLLRIRLSSRVHRRLLLMFLFKCVLALVERGRIICAWMLGRQDIF